MIRLMLREILEERNMTQKELSDLTGINVSTLNDIIRDRRTTLNKKHISNIVNVLEITDLNQLFKIY